MKYSAEIQRGKTWHKIACFDALDYAILFCEAAKSYSLKLVENWPSRKLLGVYTNGIPDREVR